MPERRRLPVEVEAYQNQCWNGNDYVGFQCPDGNPNCPLKAGDGKETYYALNLIYGLYELDHKDSTRFSRVRETLAEDVVMRCSDCHTRRHADDPSASRLSWSRFDKK